MLRWRKLINTWSMPNRFWAHNTFVCVVSFPASGRALQTQTDSGLVQRWHKARPIFAPVAAADTAIKSNKTARKILLRVQSLWSVRRCEAAARRTPPGRGPLWASRVRSRPWSALGLSARGRLQLCLTGSWYEILVHSAQTNVFLLRNVS